MGVAWARPRAFTQAQKDEVRVVAQLAADALGRAQVLKAERAARQQQPERLVTVNAVGLPEPLLAHWRAYPLSDFSPSRRALETSAIVYVPTAADLAADRPHRPRLDHRGRTQSRGPARQRPRTGDIGTAQPAGRHPADSPGERLGAYYRPAETATASAGLV